LSLSGWHHEITKFTKTTINAARCTAWASLRQRAVLLSVGLLLAVALLSAHHSLASEFDVDQTVKLTGRVTRIEWVNPHAWFYIDVTDAHGRATAWSLQMGSPNSLVRRGWTKNSVRIGDVVTVEGSRAKDGSHAANIRSVVLPSGLRLLTGPVEGKTS
jgi:hypothetical protein